MGAHRLAPSLWKVLHAERALEQLQLKIEAYHDMQIVGRLVGVSANDGARHFVDGPMEHGNWNAPELVRKNLLQRGIKMLPEIAAAPDHVLPEPRLAFMDTRRGTSSQRRAVERDAYTLFVHRMAGLVQCRE